MVTLFSVFKWTYIGFFFFILVLKYLFKEFRPMYVVQIFFFLVYSLSLNLFIITFFKS